MNTSSQTPEQLSPSLYRVAGARWGGAALALGAVLYVAAIILFVTLYGRPEGTGPGGGVTLADTAAHMHNRWTLARGLWCTELIGALLIGLAASLLQHRRQSDAQWLPANAAWIAVAVGASILTVMYAITLGSYPPALAAFPEQPAVFASLSGGMRSAFYIGMAAMFLGLTGAFVAEALATDTVLPRWLAFVGTAVHLLATIRWIAMFEGFIRQPSPPLGVTAFLLAGAFGLSICRRGGEREAAP